MELDKHRAQLALLSQAAAALLWTLGVAHIARAVGNQHLSVVSFGLWFLILLVLHMTT